MKRFMHYFALILAAVVLTLISQQSSYSRGPAAQAAAPARQASCATFPETGKTVCGRFLQYWQTHGGVRQQGFPISDEMREISETDGKSYTVQYFERAIFELHPENKAPNDVLLSLLGVLLYNQKYPGGAPGQAPSTAVGSVASFPFGRSPYTVRGEFVVYWVNNGQLAQFGYPLSNEFREVSPLDGKTYIVQYFERAVFESHPENAPPYNVLLSQLGTFRYRQKYGGAAGPTANPTTGPGQTTSTATPVPTSTFTHTPVPPSDTPEPKPTRTPVPTMCPAFDHLGITCYNTGNGYAVVNWNVDGGGGQIEGELTAEEEGGPSVTHAVSGRSGQGGYAPDCGFRPPVLVTFSLELHDECGHTVSATCATMSNVEPCP
jgi:hypothetical protein